VTLPAGEVTGTLSAWDDTNPADVLLNLQPPLGEQDLEGRYIVFDNAERSDASYLIKRVVDPQTISIGSNSLIERFVDPEDYEKGVLHTIAPGDAFAVALSAVWQRE
jgi:hypothetical protein